MITVKVSSKICSEFVKQLLKRLIWFKNPETMPIITSEFVFCVIDGRNGFTIYEEDNRHFDLKLESESDIFQTIETVYKKELFPVPISITLNRFAMVSTKLNIKFNEISLTHGTVFEKIPAEVFQTISTMYTYTWVSKNLRINSISKHTFEINGKDVGTILLQDMCFINELYNALNMEFVQFMQSYDEYPDYGKFEEALTKYLSPYMTGIFSKYLQYKKSTVSQIFINTLHKLDILKNQYNPITSNAIKIPPTGISEQR